MHDDRKTYHKVYVWRNGGWRNGEWRNGGWHFLITMAADSPLAVIERVVKGDMLRQSDTRFLVILPQQDGRDIVWELKLSREPRINYATD